MPDHLHVIVQGETSQSDTWKTMVDFKQSTGYWLSKNRPAIRWQKDFHDHGIRGTKELAQHIKYILNNPVRAGLVGRWEDYPYIGSIGMDFKAVLAELMFLVTDEI